MEFALSLYKNVPTFAIHLISLIESVHLNGDKYALSYFIIVFLHTLSINNTALFYHRSGCCVQSICLLYLYLIRISDNIVHLSLTWHNIINCIPFCCILAISHVWIQQFLCHPKYRFILVKHFVKSMKCHAINIDRNKIAAINVNFKWLFDF